jgi:hypothetical protein
MSAKYFEPTRLLTPIHAKRTVHNCIYTRLPEDEPLGSKHVEDTKKLKMKVLI